MVQDPEMVIKQRDILLNNIEDITKLNRKDDQNRKLHYKVVRREVYSNRLLPMRMKLDLLRHIKSKTNNG